MSYINNIAGILDVYNIECFSHRDNKTFITTNENVLGFNGYISYLKRNNKKILPGFLLNYSKILIFLYCIGVKFTSGCINEYIIVTPNGLMIYLDDLKLNKVMNDVKSPEDLFTCKIDDKNWVDLISHFMRENKKTIVDTLYGWDKKMKKSVDATTYGIFRDNLKKCIKF